QAKTIEADTFLVPHETHRMLQKSYDRFKTCEAAFVIQFRFETELVNGQFAGKVEHIRLLQGKPISLARELLCFIARSKRKNPASPLLSPFSGITETSPLLYRGCMNFLSGKS